MGYIKPETIDQIFEATDTLKVLEDYAQFKKKGANYFAKSPFTDEQSASFSYSPSKGVWKCFSTGKGGNSAVSFLMEKEGFTYPEALEHLAKKFNVTIQYEDGARAKEVAVLEERRKDLRPVLQSTILQFQKAFEALPDDHDAKKEVFGHRQYTTDIVEKYTIGYAPGGDFIYKLCAAHGKVDEAHAIGIIDKDKKRDKWVNRVIYPLMERKGTTLFPVGIAGRRLGNDPKYAKWMNSADSELYNKSKFWYGLENAREAIVKTGEAWILEGYNDVIGWQTNGIKNSIASSGTAIATGQVKLLSKLCKKVILCFDADKAGRAAILKHIPMFLRSGYRVQLVSLKDGVDPDDFIRKYKVASRKSDLSRPSLNAKYRQDGFGYLMREKFKGKDSVEKISEAKKLAQILKKVDDEGMYILYSDWLKKESGVTAAQIKSWLKIQQEEVKELKPDSDEYYILPKNVTKKLDELRPTIERYQMFVANSQIWVQVGTEPPFSFKSVSNFSIEIIQHMQDEKRPMKLVRVKNIHGNKKIFDMLSSDMNAQQSFENAVTDHGNFRWKGARKEHEMLKTYLFDSMGIGRKIDVLGWQPEGFWCWNNRVKIPGKDYLEVDENGVFDLNDVSYYVPSANQIYRSNLYKYEAQKKIVSVTPQNLSFTNYASQVIKVHRAHGMMGILFSIASIFQDVVVSELGMFPMLFLFGPPSSGKDQLAACCQRFFGTPQTAINLEGNVSTIKAQVREFAQFSNTISQLSEYKPGNPSLDGVLKGLWDRRGYKRGNVDSHVGTESIPILSSVLMTGNFAPEQEAVITRFMWCNMNKESFNEEEDKEYEKLADMTAKGISGFTDIFLNHRETVKNNFKEKFRTFKATLKERHQDVNGRMIENLSVMGTFYQMFQNVPEVSFPFTHNEMMDHFANVIQQQMNKLSSASIINRWWDCFIASMRGTLTDQIRYGRDFNISGDILYFQFTSCFNRVQRQWFSQYKDNSPGKSIMAEALKKEKFWVEEKATHRYTPGRQGRVTSAYAVSLKEISVADEIRYAADFQSHENSMFPPATPQEKLNIEDEDAEDLPF